jgi:molybdopterin/thiamine biosynthesis adenylyltransferase
VSDYFLTQELIAENAPAFTPRLFDRSVLVVGLGGNGCHVALAAVRMGFARVVGIDRDVVADSNLSRQVLYTREDVGRRKAEAAAEALARHNLRSTVEAYHLDIVAERHRFGELVAQADLVFLALDQPSTTFYAADASYRLGRPAVSGGTCVLSGVVSRVAWMVPGERPCLNCLLPIHKSWAEWVRFYSYDDGGPREPTPGVARVEETLRLEGGHPSTYPTACIGSNLMMALAVNIFMGRRDLPRCVEFSVLDLGVEARPVRPRANCPTCSPAVWTASRHGPDEVR